MRLVRAAVFAVLCVLLGPSYALSQDVTLRSREGDIMVEGSLLGFDGAFYRLETVYGEVTVDAARVTCEGRDCPDLENFVPTLRLSGAAVMGEVLMPALLEAFALREGYDTELQRTSNTGFTQQVRDPETGKPVARFEFGATTTDEGFADLLAKTTDIVLSTREIRPEERRRTLEAGLGDLSEANRSRILALDAIVPIVAPANPVRRISAKNLALVFSGRITNWSRLGGPDAPIALHLPEARSGLGQAIVDRLMGPAGLTLSETATRHALGRDVTEAVADDPHALGLASYSEIGNATALTLTGDCGFGLAANRRNIKTEDYPLTAPLYLYLPARRLPEIGRDFLSFLRSPSAQLVIRRAGFVDQTPEEFGIDGQGQRLAHAIASAGRETGLVKLQRMVAVLAPMQRLSTTFRFEEGSARLDPQSLSNVQQLARSLEQGRYDGRRLLFVGFSDRERPTDASGSIALRRAEMVRRAVIAAARGNDLDRVDLDVDAFGDAMPLACDDSVWGRQANRRVEVWVR